MWPCGGWRMVRHPPAEAIDRPPTTTSTGPDNTCRKQGDKTRMRTPPPLPNTHRRTHLPRQGLHVRRERSGEHDGLAVGAHIGDDLADLGREACMGVYKRVYRNARVCGMSGWEGLLSTHATPPTQHPIHRSEAEEEE